MKIIDYIKGNRKGLEANRLEKESMSDPFLFEAIEGFDSLEDDHNMRIVELQNKMLSRRKKNKRSTLYYWKPIAAACTILILSLTAYLVVDNNSQKNLYAAAEIDIQDPILINVYVPENFYEENESIIERKNKSLTNVDASILATSRLIQGTLSRDYTGIQENESLELRETGESTNNDTIYIYLPEDYTYR